MKSNYKKLGKYIEVVNVRNKDLKVENLLGVSIRKVLMPSIANTVGTNMKTYKIIQRNQFAYGPVTSRNGDKISVALLEEFDEAIVSQAYTVFKVLDDTILDPEYLMMWFRRTEFDRYARFMSHGSARETFDWDEMLEIELPIPSIEKQNEIVKEYNTIVNRIKLNEQLNKKLEETAQAIYKHWFVDFEFPNEDGKPYKSSGGKLVFNAELDKEIPEGWEVGKWDKYVKLSQGQVINATTRHLVVEKGLPLLKITDLFNDTATMFIDEEKVADKNIAKKEDLIYTRTGQVGYIFRNKEGVVYNNCFKIIPIQSQLSTEFIFWHFKNENVRKLMIELASGSAQSDLAHTAFFSVSVVKPSEKTQDSFERSSKIIVNQIFNKEENIKGLIKLKDLLLSKMSKVELEKEIEV